MRVALLKPPRTLLRHAILARVAAPARLLKIP